MTEPKTMDSAEFRLAKTTLGFNSAEDMGRMIGCTGRQVRRMVAGHRPVSEPIALILRACVKDRKVLAVFRELVA